jgi:GAF domain-containing protein
VLECTFAPTQKFWRQILVSSDIGLISVLYYLTGAVESDFFLFYYLPIVTAAEDLKVRRVVTVGAAAALSLMVVILTLARSATPPPTESRLLFAILLPREFFLGIVTVVSCRLLNARSALPAALQEVVRVTSSASALNRELDSLLDRIMQLGFDQAAIALVDDSLDVIQIVRARGQPPRQMAMARFPLQTNDIMCSVVTSARTEFFPAGLRDPRFNSAIYDTFGHDNLSRLFVPLIPERARSAIGTLECGCFGKERRQFVQDQAGNVERLAKKSAMAIGANRTHVLLSTIATKAIEIVGADSASLHVFRKQELLYQAGAGLADTAFLKRFPPRKDGFGRIALNTGRPVAVDTAELKKSYPGLFETGIRALLALPLTHLGNEELSGVLYVHFWHSRARPSAIPGLSLLSRSHRRFTARTVEIETIFARQLEAVIQNYLSLRDSAFATELAWHVSLLQNFIQSLASIRDHSEMLRNIAKGALLYLPDSDCVTLYEYVSSAKLVSYPPVMEGTFHHKEAMVTTIRPDVVDWLVGMARSRYLDDVSTLPELAAPRGGAGRERFVSREGIVSSAQLPLRDNSTGDCVGFLFVNYRKRHPFTDSERKAIDSFASAAAIAIINSRLFHSERIQKERTQQLEQTLGELHTPLATDDVASKIIDRLRSLVGFSTASVQQIDDQSRVIVHAAGFESQSANPQLLCPINEDPFIERVFKSQRPTVVSDCLTIKGWTLPTVRSWLGIPLFFRDKPIGLVTADSPEAGVFDKADIVQLTRLGRQAGVELNRAIELERVNRRVRHLELLREIYEITDAHFRTDHLLQEVARHVAARLGCDQCSVFLKERDQATESCLRARAAEGRFSKDILGRTYHITPMSPSDTTLSPVLQAFQENRALLRPDDAGAKRKKPRSTVVAPIAAGDHKIGVLSAEKNTTRYFKDSDTYLLHAIARSVGHAIERARGMRLIQEVGEEILSAQKVDDVLKKIMSGAVSILDVDAASIYLDLSNGNRSRSPTPTSYVHPEGSLPDPWTEALLQRVSEASQPIVVSEVEASGEEVSESVKRIFRSLVAVPFRRGHELDGAMFLFSRSSRSFTGLELSLLQSLANDAALIIQKTKRLEHAQGRLEESEQRKSAMNRLLGINQLAAILFHYVNEPLRASRHDLLSSLAAA